VKETDDDGAPVFYTLSELLKSLKGFTALEINKLERATGSVWEAESFDRLIRSEADLQEKFEYVRRNPWAENVIPAGDEYPWIWYAGIEQERAAAPHAMHRTGRPLPQARRPALPRSSVAARFRGEHRPPACRG
jgi:hypothetical protein